MMEPADPGSLLALVILFFAAVAFFWLIYMGINYSGKNDEESKRNTPPFHCRFFVDFPIPPRKGKKDEKNDE